MIKKLSDNITLFLLSQHVISKDDFDIYSYGLEYILSLGINLIGILIISLMTNSLISNIGFVMGFLLMRSSAGGYHAKTHAKCVLISYLTIYLNIFVNALCQQYDTCKYELYICIISFASIYLIFKFSPCDHPNKLFSAKEAIRFKIQSRTTILLISILAIVGSVFINRHGMLFLSVSLGALTASISVGVVKIKERKRHGKSSIINY